MPELPEATTIARGLDRAITGLKVAGVCLNRRDFLKRGRPDELPRLVGQRVRKVWRRGKSVIIDLDRGRLVLQLGMAGRVYLEQSRQAMPPHTHFVLSFPDKLEMRYANSRRIASGVSLVSLDELGPLDRLGPDGDMVTREDFARRLTAHRLPIKAALMCPTIVAGVGNIYSDEALFRAGVRPTRRANRLRPDELAKLHKAVRQVLAEAIAAGGSTIRRAGLYRDAQGGLGEFTTRHRVYGRYGQPCLTCGTGLRRVIIGGRTGTYCPRCQR